MDLDSTFTVDASEHAAVGILSQGGHPVAFVSHNFTPAERNWSNIEREAYAVVWCTQRLHQFLLGHRFTIQSDHHLLEFIFANHVDGSHRVFQRIARWALSLAQFDFNNKYTPGSSLPHLDGLSRLQSTNQDELIFFSDLHDGEMPGTDDLDSALVLQVKKLLADDTLYSCLLWRITTGNWKNITSLETPLFKAHHLLLLQPVHLNQRNNNGTTPKFHVSKLQSFYFETFTINIIIIKTKQLLFYFNKIK